MDGSTIIMTQLLQTQCSSILLRDPTQLMLLTQRKLQHHNNCELYSYTVYIAGNFLWVLFSTYFRYREPKNEKLAYETLDSKLL